eukprot:992629-Prymnesium_polylepis.1
MSYAPATRIPNIQLDGGVSRTPLRPSPSPSGSPLPGTPPRGCDALPRFDGRSPTPRGRATLIVIAFSDRASRMQVAGCTCSSRSAAP